MPIIKMTEKFAHGPDAAAPAALAKRSFYVAQASIRVQYHVPQDRLFASYRVFSKAGKSHIVAMDPLSVPLDATAQLEQFQELLAAEKECSRVRQLLAYQLVQSLLPAKCEPPVSLRTLNLQRTVGQPRNRRCRCQIACT